MTYATTTLTGPTYRRPDGVAARGYVSITPTVAKVYDDAGNVVISGAVRVPLVNGTFTVALPSTDDVHLSPSGFGYRLTEHLTHGGPTAAVSFLLPTTPSTVALLDVAEIDPTSVEAVAWRDAFRDEMEAVLGDAIDLSGIATTDAAVRALVLNTGGAGPLTSAALAATYALKGATGAPASPSHAPFYVPTMSLAGSTKAAPGARTGLATSTVPVVQGDGTSQAQGYAVENVATGVSGSAGAYTLTVTDTAHLATLDGDGSSVWDCAIVNGDGRATTNTVLDVVGGTVTLLHALPYTLTGATLSSRVDVASGQHLTRAGYKALAQWIAATSPVLATRGGIIEGQWDTLPSQYRTLWSKNAALTAYGVSNSAAPLVQSSLQPQGALNWYDTPGLLRRANVNAGGVMIGTHTSGHGGLATLRTGRRPALVEFTTSADRSDVVPGARIRVKATAPDGTVLYDKTVSGGLRWHRIPVVGVDAVSLDATNTDGGIYNLHLSQLTVREAGTAGPLRPKKVLLLGDSWTQYYDHLLGTELATALGAEVVTFGKGGTTTDWGIAWLDTALAANPGCDTVVLHFYTNDLNNNQSSTMTIPGGSTVAMWPNGLTLAQAEARWVAQINLLVSMIQQRGLRPVVVLPGTVNFGNQPSAAIHAEQPRLIDWSATAAELADTTAYVNNVGKSQGALVKVGSSVKYAKGPLPADGWGNPAEDALEPLQRQTLSRATYAQSVAVGTDTNADGLSDGFDKWTFGTDSGDVWTPSIVSGRQRIATTWAATGTANHRLRHYFNATSGRDYLVLWDINNATSGMSFGNSFSDITGAAVLLGSTTGNITVTGTAGQVYYRATANATATKYAALGVTRVNSGTNTHDVISARVIDLTALFADAPNLATKTTAELVAFVQGMKP